VDEKMRSAAINYEKAYLRGDNTGWNWPYNVNAELCTKAFMVFSLAVNKAGDQGYITELFSRLDQMPLFGKAYLLKAVNREKMDRAMIDEIERDLFNKIKMAPTEAHFEESDDEGMAWIWHSNVRSTALIMQAILEVDGTFANAEKTARWLASERKSGRWNSTQENIYVFHAFNEYVKHYEKEKPDFTAQVKLDGKKIVEEVFSGRSLAAKGSSFGIEQYKRDVSLPLEIGKKGPGRLYYELRMIYAPNGELPERSEGMAVEKTIIRMKDNSAATGIFNMGEKYMVKLKVKTDQERHFVVLDDPLPAGFEVINLSLSTESTEDAISLAKAGENSAYRWWGTFDHWENYDDRVLVFANYLTRGDHEYSYLVQATTPGEFFMPAAKAEEMYTPEVFGRTGQKVITVK
jgi:alpha-2-macroglobulin